ncbi:unnamed protein product [Acanthosepion pharaonis]|uniref:Uncharacterized protein n=1 Tax=Acanthosepion pharaonis TaxID=158019 RepID=A0A812B9T5_ACAPH|nr:unnamed protein product [Sepia pharaonis]
MFRCQLFPTLSPNRFIFLFFFRPAVVFSSFQQNSSSSNLISFLSCNWIFMAFLVFSQSYLSFSFLYTRHGFYLSSFHSDFFPFSSISLCFFPSSPCLSLSLSLYIFPPFSPQHTFFFTLTFWLFLSFSHSPSFFGNFLPLSLFLWEFPPTLPLSLGISSHSPSFFGNFLPLSLFLWEFPPSISFFRVFFSLHSPSHLRIFYFTIPSHCVFSFSISSLVPSPNPLIYNISGNCIFLSLSLCHC